MRSGRTATFQPDSGPLAGAVLVLLAWAVPAVAGDLPAGCGGEAGSLADRAAAEQRSDAAAAAREPFERELALVYLFEPGGTEFILRIGQSGFRTVAALEEHLKTWPRGSTLRWAPGCIRFGDEPILNSEEDLEAFRAFLESRGIRFDLLPSG